jgi:hypothetical protein
MQSARGWAHNFISFCYCGWLSIKLHLNLNNEVKRERCRLDRCDIHVTNNVYRSLLSKQGVGDD